MHMDIACLVSVGVGVNMVSIVELGLGAILVTRGVIVAEAARVKLGTMVGLNMVG